VARFVERNPVRAKLVACAEDWPWSSARAHLSGRDDCLVKVAPLLAMISDWRVLLNSARPEGELKELRSHGRTGRPLGDETFLDRLEGLVGRVLKPQKGGRPKKQKN
jgi:putative transposase